MGKKILSLFFVMFFFVMFFSNFVFAENTTIIYTGNNTTQIYQSFDNTNNGVVFNFIFFSVLLVGFIFFLLYYFRVNNGIIKFSAVVFSFYIFFSDLLIISNVNSNPFSVVDLWINIFSVLSYGFGAVIVILVFTYPIKFIFTFIIRVFEYVKRQLK